MSEEKSKRESIVEQVSESEDIKIDTEKDSVQLIDTLLETTGPQLSAIELNIEDDGTIALEFKAVLHNLKEEDRISTKTLLHGFNNEPYETVIEQLGASLFKVSKGEEDDEE